MLAMTSIGMPHSTNSGVVNLSKRNILSRPRRTLSNSLDWAVSIDFSKKPGTFESRILRYNVSERPGAAGYIHSELRRFQFFRYGRLIFYIQIFMRIS